jgi:uncharacterized coiled-coil protein SlyX
LDLLAVQALRDRISLKYQRTKQSDTFLEGLTMVLSFVNQNDAEDWKRSLVCGVCQCDEIIAVNNARLQEFSCRSKSGLNELFAKLGYQTIAINRINQVQIVSKIPFLAKHYDELRQWTYRVKKTEQNRILIRSVETECHPPAEEIPHNTTGTEQDFTEGWGCFDDCFFGYDFD